MASFEVRTFDLATVVAGKEVVARNKQIAQVVVAAFPYGADCSLSFGSSPNVSPKFVGQEWPCDPPETGGLYFTNPRAQVGTVSFFIAYKVPEGVGIQMHGAGPDFLAGFNRLATGGDSVFNTLSGGVPLLGKFQLFNPVGSGIIVLAQMEIVSASQPMELLVGTSSSALTFDSNTAKWLDFRQSGNPLAQVRFDRTAALVAGRFNRHRITGDDPLTFFISSAIVAGQGLLFQQDGTTIPQRAGAWWTANYYWQEITL